MGKMRDIARGVRAVKAVSFRRANAGSVQPGSDPSSDSAQVRLGVRVLLGAETLEVYEKAAAAARDHGVATWDAEDPVCSLFMMAHTLHIACVDLDSDEKRRERFFESVEQILEDDELGTDNIALLYEQQVQWQDEVSGKSPMMTVAEVTRLVLDDAGRKPGDPGPLVHLRHASLVSCVRTMGQLSLTLLTARSLTGLDSVTPTASSSSAEAEAAAQTSAPPPSES